MFQPIIATDSERESGLEFSGLSGRTRSMSQNFSLVFDYTPLLRTDHFNLFPQNTNMSVMRRKRRGSGKGIKTLNPKAGEWGGERRDANSLNKIKGLRKKNMKQE